MKLLIADDQQSLHTFLDKMMDWTKLGISQVTHAYDGKETIEMVKQLQPDLLIIDIQMPFLSGIDTLKELNELHFKPKALILSAYDEFEYAREALRLSVTQYLLKPVDTEQLEAAVEEMIVSIRSEQQEKLEELLSHVTEHDPNKKWLENAEHIWRVFNIESYIVLTVSGHSESKEEVLAMLNGLEQQPVVIAVQSQHGRRFVILLGWSYKLRQEQLILFYDQLEERWKTSFPDQKLVIGGSKLGTLVTEVRGLVEQSRLAQIEGFYEDTLMNVYSDTRVSMDSWTVQHYLKFNQAFEEKFALDFTFTNVKELITSLFDTIHKLKLEPEEVYALVKYYWSMAVQTMQQEQRISADVAPSIERLQQYVTLAELKHYFISEMSKLIVDTDGAALQTEEVITRVKDYVDRHYGEELSLQHVADRFRMDKYQLSRLFKHQYGINYWQYVTTVRLNKAAELLTGTTLKNNAIAEMTGFVDESHLSKTFKKHFNVSPKEYRTGK